MTVVADTSVLIDHLRGRTEARDLLEGLLDQGERLCGSVLTRTEIVAGARSAEAHRIEALLSVLTWVPVDPAIADRAGALARAWLGSHPGVDTVDYVIAATADALGARLLTRNVKHFPMFAGLKSPY